VAFGSYPYLLDFGGIVLDILWVKLTDCVDHYEGIDDRIPTPDAICKLQQKETEHRKENTR